MKIRRELITENLVVSVDGKELKGTDGPGNPVACQESLYRVNNCPIFLSSIHVTVTQDQNSLLLKMKCHTLDEKAFLEEDVHKVLRQLRKKCQNSAEKE